jgi:fluoride exporter
VFQKIFWLSIAGACGTLSRYTLCEFASKLRHTHIPIGTFAVNIIGSFLFGLIYMLAQRKIIITHEARVILLVGFMGAFTTFSTFAFDTAKMMKASQWALAFGNVFAQTALGIVALAAGVMVARQV